MKSLLGFSFSLLLLGTLPACSGNPIDDCMSSRIDCCTEDADCLDYYGREAPYCLNPGRTTGICGECLSDTDCSGADACYLDNEVGSYCAP